MTLFEWRKSNDHTLAETAARLGLNGANPARDLQRFERGERRPSALLVEAIVAATDGSVTPEDMHRVRLEWERRSLEVAS